MDDIFARCVDVIALAGQSGITLSKCVERVTDTPRPALVLWLYRNCKKREPGLFTVNGNDSKTAVIVASRPLRERALGFTSLEHAPLQKEAWRILEAVGQAGRDGALQSQLSKDLHIGAVMLHHYLGSLLALKLVVRRKIVLTSSRKKGKNAPKRKPTAFANVTQTCVITLARYAASIGTATATKTVDSGIDACAEGEESVIYNIDLEERTQKILEVLRETPGGIAPERDLKLIAIPDKVGNRHRLFRSIKEKIVKANLVKKVVRQCVDINGELRGMLPCFALIGCGKQADASQVVTGAVDFEDDFGDEEETEEPDSVDEIEKDEKRAGMLLEVDIAEQVYRAFDNSGSRGMSCPEVVEMLDGRTGNAGIEYKRMRSLLNIMENTHSLKPLQHFNASACHKRFVLQEHHIEDGTDWPPDKPASVAQTPNSDAANAKVKLPTGRGRTVSGNLTTLGTKRRAILEEILNKEKVMQADKLGRVIAEAEGSAKHVDVKVTRKIIDSMIGAKLCRYMNVGKPRFGGSKTPGTMKLLVSSQVPENGPEIREFLSRFVKRSMAPADSRTNTPTPRKRKSKKRRSIVDQHDIDDVKKRKSSVSNPYETTDGKVYLDVDGRGGLDSRTHRSESDGNITQTNPPMNKFAEGEDSEDQRDPNDHDKILPASAQVLVKTPTRAMNQRNPRLSKLRSADYGFIRPRMRRARLLHEYLVRFVVGEDFLLDSVTAVGLMSITQSTIEVTGQTKDLGMFNYGTALKSMSVGLHANLFGISNDHGALDQSIKLLSMSSAPTNILQEMNSRSSVEQARVLFSILWDLGLVYSTSNMTWYLRGSGVFRDFGRGIPAGSSSHSIIFNSFHAIETYWGELESLSNPADILATYVPDPQSIDLFGKNVLKNTESVRDQNSKQVTVAELPHIYIAKHWVPTKRGNVRTVAEDELIMEMVLQNIVVGWKDDGSMPKKIDTWEQGVLPWISVDTLYDSRFLLDKGYRRRRSRPLQMSDLEYLVQYSRKRMRFRVSAQVLRLSQKPNNKESDYMWLQKAFPRKRQPSKHGEIFKSIDRRPLLQRKNRRKGINPGNDEHKLEYRDRKKRYEDGLVFEECVLLLKLVTKMQALVANWRKQSVMLSVNEGDPVLWSQILELVEMPKCDCDEVLNMVFKNEFVSRYLNAFLDGLVNSINTVGICVEGDSHLLHVPEKIVDCFGQELSLEDAIRAILEESSLTFRDKPKSSVFTISLSKRKSILRRLRSSMTGAGISASTPDSSSKARESRSRIRLLSVQDTSENLCYGLLRLNELQPKWISPFSVNKHIHSEGRRNVISLLVMSILDEPEPDFDVRIVLYILSRFPEGEIIGMRNDLYKQERISLLQNRSRAFRVDLTSKRPDLLYSSESHDAVHEAEVLIKSLPDSSDGSVGSKLFHSICAKDKKVESQGMLIAAVQMLLFPKEHEVGIIPHLRDNGLCTEFRVNGSVDIESVERSITDVEANFVFPQFKPCLQLSDKVSANKRKTCSKEEYGPPSQISTPIVTETQDPAVDKCISGTPESIGQDAHETILKRTREYTVDIASSAGLPTDCERNGISMKSVKANNRTAENSWKEGCDYNDGKKTMGKVLDEDRVRLELEWIHEVNMRRLREFNSLSYYKSQANPVFAAILQWIIDAKSKGLTSYEISNQSDECGFSGEQIVYTIEELLKEGVVYRFGCGNALTPGDRAPAVYMTASFAWTFAVVPVSVDITSDVDFAIDWGRVRPLSPWLRINGQYNTKLIEAVQVHTLNVAAKRPGVEEKHLVASVMSREPLLSERAVLDAITALVRCGRLKRNIYLLDDGRATIFGSHLTETPETTVSLYPDGFELTGQGRFVLTFYSVTGGSAIGQLLSGPELDSVSSIK